jgi:hypothetical protein
MTYVPMAEAILLLSFLVAAAGAVLIYTTR